MSSPRASVSVLISGSVKARAASSSRNAHVSKTLLLLLGPGLVPKLLCKGCGTKKTEADFDDGEWDRPLDRLCKECADQRKRAGKHARKDRVVRKRKRSSGDK